MHDLLAVGRPYSLIFPCAALLMPVLVLRGFMLIMYYYGIVTDWPLKEHLLFWRYPAPPVLHVRMEICRHLESEMPPKLNGYSWPRKGEMIVISVAFCAALETQS
jgi:hypothetical protein